MIRIAPSLIRLVLTLQSVCLWLTSAASAAEPKLTAVWSNLADSQNLAAQLTLESLHTEQTNCATLLASAAVRMARQPVTDENLRAAETSLIAVAQGDDELAALAGYLRARLYQAHFPSANYARAAELYRELARRQPQSHWARLGLVKLGMLTLYALPEPADSVARLRAAGELLPWIAEPGLQRDLNLQLARAAVLYKRPVEEVLVYLKAVDRVGGLVGLVAEDLVVQLGELSLRTGRLAESRAYFERVLRDFPSNARTFNIKQKLVRLAELERAAAKGGGS